MALRLRRGTNAGRLGITPVEGELIYTTDTKTVYVGDGVTVGGNAVSGGGGGGATDLNSLTDVTITSPTNGQVLKYNGTAWVNGTDDTGGGGGGVTYGISAETDIGGVNLRLTGSDASTDDIKLAEGANITLTRTSANIITIASTGTSGASNLTDLGDVVLGTLAPDEFLKYDGSNWVNSTVPAVGLNDITGVSVATPPVVNSVLLYDGTGWTDGVLSLADLDGMAIATTPTVGDQLRWDGGAWESFTPASTVSSVNGQTSSVTLDTDDIAEGTVNKYASATNVGTVVSQIFNGGTFTNINYTYNSGTNTIDLEAVYQAPDPNDVNDAAGLMLATGNNTGITFTYNSTTHAITSVVNFPATPNLDDLPDVNYIGTPADGDVLTWSQITTAAITQVSRTSNLASITTSAPHTFTVGQIITVNSSNNEFDATKVACQTGTAGTTIVYNSTGTDIPITAASGVVSSGGWQVEQPTVFVTDLSEDIAPTLAGDLTLNLFDIKGSGNIDITGSIACTGDVTIGEGNYNSGLAIVSQIGGLSGGILDIESYTAVAGAQPVFQFFRARGTAAAPVSVTQSSGDTLGGFRFIGLGSNTSATQLASVVVTAFADPFGTIRTDSVPGAFGINIRADDGTINPVLGLNRNGRLTVSPGTGVAGSASSNLLTAGVGSGQVNTGSVTGYYRIRIGTTEYALPYYSINP